MALTKATLIDLNSNELILDLDADTSITADTDDTIHFKIAGADEIVMTGTAFTPAVADGSALGSTSLEWSDLFLADGAVINFGADQDINITHVADTGLTTNADFTVGDDLFIQGGLIDLKNDGSFVSQIKFYCESSNAHAQTLIGAPHSESASNTLTLPSSGGNSRLLSAASTATLTNKTLTSPKINEDVAVTSTATEINILDGATVTTSELNFLDGGSTIGTTAIADGDGIIHNDDGSIKQTTAATFKTYFQQGLSSNVPSSADGQALGSASLEWSDLFLADGGTIQFGNDQDVILTHVADTGLLLSGTNVIQFNDASQNIGAPSNAILDINATDEIELNATLVDINANADISGTLTLAGNLIVGSATVTEAQLEILDGATVTTTELNLIDGGATVGTTAIADGDGLLINDAGTMRVSTVQTLAAYLDDEITAMPNLVTVGAANTLTTVAGIPLYQGDSGSIYTHDVSGTDNSAQFNSAYGLTAMDAITTGDDNTAMGYGALGATTTGATNSAFGKSALLVNTTGGSNTAIGREALLANTEGSTNTAVGLVALAANTTASNNTAVGASAGLAVTTGAAQVFIGAEAGKSLTSAGGNIAIGYQALDAADTENNNLAIGEAALGVANSGAENNIAIGKSSLDALTSGDDNTAVGYNAGSALTTTTANTFIGNGAAQAATTASGNTIVGAYASQSGTLTGNNNVVVGKLAGYNMTSADASVIIGEDAGLETTTANNNVLIGQGAGENITSGGSNIFVGQAAGDGHDAETNNVGIGKGALGGAIAGGEYNVAVGNGAGASLTTADNTVLIGYNAGLNTTTGPASVAIGKEALRDQTTGGGASVGYNIGIGELGLYNVTTAAPNIGIGGFSQASSATGTHQIVLGYNVTGSGNSTFTFGAGSSDTTCSHGATSFSAPSDERWKKDIETSTCGLSFIDDLRPVSFKFKTKGELDESLNDYEKDSTEIAGFTDDSILGFIAQEVKTVIDNHSEFKGSELWKEGLEKQDKRQRISKEALIPILVKAVQELSTEIKKLKGE